MNVAEAGALAEAVRVQVAKAVVGQDEAVELLLTALLAQGHVLLEGPPGVAKTFLVHSFAAAVGLAYGRIQFTPDLMPGDILGANLFNFQTSAFVLTRGPIFTELLLADEINRTPPKTQAALLEAMQERTVTLDGVGHPLPQPFVVVATENPLESQGAYPLPEAQLDRFLFKHLMGYPSEDEEVRIVGLHGQRTTMPAPDRFGVTRVADAQALSAAAAAASAVRLTDEIIAYIVAIVRATRSTSFISVGASPRSGAMLASAARARAVLKGRDYVIPDDVKALALPALRHRIMLSADAEIEGRRVDAVVQGVLDGVEPPR